MAQYRDGTASLVIGSNVVLGQGTKWLTEVRQGDFFMLPRTTHVYLISAVVSDTVLHLFVPYEGASVTTVAYSIHRHFTPFYSIPYPEYGDTNTAELFQRAVLAIEQAFLEQDSGLTVIAARQSTPPVSPAERESYIVTATATGAWLGKEKYIATWDGVRWGFVEPLDGWRVNVRAEQYGDFLFDADLGSWVPGPIGSVTTAVSGQVSLAQTAATNAATSATSAAGSASTALTRMNSAATSATNAGTSATNAATSATAAATSATTATTQATSATTSKNAAATSATNAAGSATAAATSATNAATSATNAATSATSALAYRDAALVARDGAVAAQTDIVTNRDAAAASATAAATSATTATTQATTATTKANAAATSATAAAGSATTATTQATTATTQATNASTSAAAALASKNLADTAKTAAETARTGAETALASATTQANTATTQATAAGTSASAASTSATAAATSATNAATSATAASTSAGTATTQATNAGTSATAAATSATNAATSATASATSATLASDWAIKTTAAVSGTDYSAKYHALAAAASASSITGSVTAAATSASNAATSATNAGTSATNAATSKTGADTAKTATETARDLAKDWAEKAVDSAVTTGLYSAKHHATKAATSATNAVTSASNALAYANTAQIRVTDATAQAVAAASSATAAATSASNALSSANAAAASATAVQSAATTASGQATAASDSAAASALSATSAATQAANALTSATTATTKATAAFASETSAKEAVDAATAASVAAVQNATAAIGAKVQAEAYRDQSLTISQTVDTAVDTAFRWAEQEPNVAVVPGFFSAKHWSTRAQFYAEQTGNIIEGNGFGSIGDGTSIQFSAASRSDNLNIVAGTNVTVEYIIATKSVKIHGPVLSGSNVPFVAAGNIAATTVQAAIEELDAEKQPLKASLTAIGALTPAADRLPYYTSASVAALATFTTFGRSLVDDADATAGRTTLGLGTIATQAASAVAITGGTVTGITDLGIADGGTGASTAAAARTNLGSTATGDALFTTASASAARTTLGLGTAATTASTDYAPIAHVGAGGTAHAVATTTVAGFLSATDKTKLDSVAANAKDNQNAFSNFTVGAITLAADSPTDTLEFIQGDGLLFTPTAATDQLTVAVVLTDTAHGSRGGAALHSLVTTSVHGFMSSTDKTKLDGVATGANLYVHPPGDGNLHVPATGTTNNLKVLKAGATAGTIAWGFVDWAELTGLPSTFTPAAHTQAWSTITATPTTLAGYAISDAAPLSHVGSGGTAHADVTTTVDGFMIAADKVKLDGIATGANNYVHPTTDGSLHVPATSTTNNGKFLKAGASAGSLAWASIVWADITSGTPTTLAGYGITDATPSSHIGTGGAAHANATTSVAGFMSGADKTTLSNATSAATASTLVLRDGSGNASFATLTTTVTITTPLLTVSNTAFPQWVLSDSDAAVDAKRWAGWVHTDTTFMIGPQTDAGTGTVALTLNRNLAATFASTVTATGFSGPLTGAVTGNASTATTLQTARNINGVSFNGSADITVADATKLTLTGGTVTGTLLASVGGGATSSTVALGAGNGNYRINMLARVGAGAYSSVAQADDSLIYFTTGTQDTGALAIAPWGTTGKGIRIASDGSFTANGSTVWHAGNLPVATANTVSTVVQRDASGNFAAGTITATGFTGPLTGNASTATKLVTARLINGVAFDGTQDITVSTTSDLPLAGGTMTGPIVLSGDPTADLHAVPRRWVEARMAKDNCRVATTADLAQAASTTTTMTGKSQTVVTNGTTAVSSTSVTNVTSASSVIAQGATVTGTGIPASTTVASVSGTTVTLSQAATAAGTVSLTFTNTIAALAIDGVTLALNDRVLVKNQSTASRNGIYYLSTLGSTTVAWVLTRSTGSDTWTDLVGALTGVEEGTVNANTIWWNSNVLGGTLGTTSVTWQLVSNALVGAIGGLGSNGLIARTGASTAAIVAYASTNTASNIVQRDGSGNFSAGTVTAALSGNASTATKLAASVTINGVAFDGSGAITVADATKLPLSGGTLTGALTLSGDPTSDLHATTKAWVEGRMAKDSVRVASTANVSLSAPGTVIDGVTLASGDRLLLKNQTAGAENGLWIWTGSAAALTRATGMDTWSDVPGALTMVEEGTTQANTVWMTTNSRTGTLGTTAIGWRLVSNSEIAALGALTGTGAVVRVGANSFSNMTVATANTASAIVQRDASGNFTAGTITATLSGNASTATTLLTARTINGVSFNGSANITVTATATNTLTLGSYLTGTSYNGSAAVTAAVDATSANTASKVVARDASGNFAAGTITATGVTTTAANQLRLKNSTGTTGYGVLHRHDGTNYYMLLTANNDADGTWNALRPFTMTLATGAMTFGNGATVTGDLNVSNLLSTKLLNVGPETGTEGGQINLLPAGTEGTVAIDNFSGNFRIFTLAAAKYVQIIGGGGGSSIELQPDSWSQFEQLRLKGTGFKYLDCESTHLAFYKKTGAEHFYWRRSDDGRSSGANNTELMNLQDSCLLTLQGGANTGYVTTDRTDYAQSWMFYASGSYARFWHNTQGERFRVEPSGNCVAQGVLYMNGNQPCWTQTTLNNLSQLTNGPGYITGITSGNVTTALGYTPLRNTSTSAATIGSSGTMGCELQGVGGGAAGMSFHRPGSYAANLGIDTDNVWKVGGWSMGTGTTYRLLHEGIVQPVANRGVGTYLAVYVPVALGIINQDTAATGTANRCIQDMGNGLYQLTSAGHIGGSWYCRGTTGLEYGDSGGSTGIAVTGRFYLFCRGS